MKRLSDLKTRQSVSLLAKVSSFFLTFEIGEDDAHIFGTSEAIQAEHAEKELTLWNGLKLYRKAVLWSVCFSALLIMEGYDTSCKFTLFC